MSENKYLFIVFNVWKWPFWHKTTLTLKLKKIPLTKLLMPFLSISRQFRVSINWKNLWAIFFSLELIMVKRVALMPGITNCWSYLIVILSILIILSWLTCLSWLTKWIFSLEQSNYVLCFFFKDFYVGILLIFEKMTILRDNDWSQCGMKCRPGSPLHGAGKMMTSR